MLWTALATLIMTPPNKKRVLQQFLDQVFNQNGWTERLAKCKKIEFHNQPTPPQRCQVPGTVTIGEKLYDPAGTLTAVLVSYRRPDGSLGASGRPSCKGLLIDGVWHYV
jgi:hypothetical protein